MMLSRLMLKSKIKQVVYKVLLLCPVCWQTNVLVGLKNMQVN